MRTLGRDRPVRPKSEIEMDATATQQIEITPAMITAGVELLYQFDPDYSDAEEFVKRFLAVVLYHRAFPQERVSLDVQPAQLVG